MYSDYQRVLTQVLIKLQEAMDLFDTDASVPNKLQERDEMLYKHLEDLHAAYSKQLYKVKLREGKNLNERYSDEGVTIDVVGDVTKATRHALNELMTDLNIEQELQKMIEERCDSYVTRYEDIDDVTRQVADRVLKEDNPGLYDMIYAAVKKYLREGLIPE